MWTHGQALALGWLTESEQGRMAGMRVSRQREFLACRYALRLLLADSPDGVAAWRLAAPQDEAPLVEAGARRARVPRLSLSHSAHWLACASATQPVGVDVECVAKSTRPRDVPALADLVCSPEEAARLLVLDAAAALQCWLQLWCLKEAYGKSVGSGVDFSRIRTLSWHPAAQDRNGRAVSPERCIAYGRSWQGITPAGETVHLALCAGHPITSVQWRGDGAVAWKSVSAWHLRASCRAAPRDTRGAAPMGRAG